MPRRVHVQQLRLGEPIPLGRAEAHHARDVLRLPDGATVEVFDDEGASGVGVLSYGSGGAVLRVERADLGSSTAARLNLRIAAAVPKGDRADWMVEKLSELGVVEFVPLAAARSVVLPEGRGKRDRWLRIATEAAKQSRRVGVMKITELTPLDEAIRLAEGDCLWFLTTEDGNALPVTAAADRLALGARVTAFVGPEGGWTEPERTRFGATGATPLRLTHTILRIETAAVAAAAVVACRAAAGARVNDLDRRAAHQDHPAAPSPTTGNHP